MKFNLTAEMKPTGGQPKAIEEITNLFDSGRKEAVLLGVTGSGKTFVLANVIKNIQRPVLVISHNKTLAAQIYAELSCFFPDNAVEYFISYYDYYQPEAYLPQTDTYIAKDASVNEAIDRLRLKATASVVSRRDVIVVASVSCIYNIGSPEVFKAGTLVLKKGEKLTPQKFARKLIDIHYSRNEIETGPGTFRIKGDVMDVYPAYETKQFLRFEFFGDGIDKINVISYPDFRTAGETDEAVIFPAKQYLIEKDSIPKAIESIRIELAERKEYFKKSGRDLEAQRLEQRTLSDIEMIENFGYCQGIENYSRHLSGRPLGSKPWCLIDYFPDDFLVVIDESHATIPQIRAMEHGDRSRKETLIEFGFRLPSALDNRPLKFEEFRQLAQTTLYMSATPALYERERAGPKNTIELIARPTGIVDPVIEICPTKGQIDVILEKAKETVGRGERVIITTLTKKSAEEFADFLKGEDMRVAYLHSEIKSLDRVEILRSLRLGDFDVIVGVNLLREGLDLPEVGLVMILDADREGFLRSETSLVQTAGRAARNLCGKVILFADEITDSMARALAETKRRRKIQEGFNREHKIIPKSIVKTREEILAATSIAEVREKKPAGGYPEEPTEGMSRIDLIEKIEGLVKEMKKAAEELEFERAAVLRDRVKKLKEIIAGRS
ncbi:excinuclease ABC subunit UvrB [candidate division WOR-3 bacterium]|nr:excinuclease ABC subunit UvrB [candidate division WOR-3 bacterium]